MAMMRLSLLAAVPLLALAACVPPMTSAVPPPPVIASPTAPFPVTAVPRELVAEQLTLAEWARADNRAACAPLGFASVGATGWTARRANFSGGWAVAFDLPGQRSAFGLAGTGSLPDDSASFASQQASLRQQWPYTLALPAVAGFAGYGLEGAAAYRAANPSGQGEHSLAYVRIEGQGCLYNIWSRLGRAHLELLLDQVRRLAPPATP